MKRDTQHNEVQHNGRVLLFLVSFMLNVANNPIMLSVIVQSVLMLSVVLLSVVMRVLLC
jgi:hypothetical protein